MKQIVNSEEMKYCDSNTILHFGVPSIVLMERAALSVVSQMPKELSYGGRILIVCGSGNNGADGLAAARLLNQQGCEVTVAKMPDHGKRTSENQTQLNILNNYQIKVLDHIPQPDVYDCVIDALFGVGLSRPPEGEYAEWIDAMNKKSGFKVAVDVPSGVSSDTGQVYSSAFKADLTVTFACLKIGHILHPGCELCGKVAAAQIGITNESWLMRRPSCYMLEKEDLKELPVRPARSNKGTFGRVLVIAGSRNMAGAALFGAKAAYRTGCGLVKIYTPKENRIIFQTARPEANLSVYDDKEQIWEGEADDNQIQEWKSSFADAIKWADVVVIGPGIGTGRAARCMVEQTLEKSHVPTVLDADALNIIAKTPELLQGAASKLIITPHLGEMGRLIKKQIPEIQNNMIKAASDFASQYRLICVLKDAVTVTASPDTVYLNTAGCSAMAKGGSGDVLTGIIAALAAQGMEPEKAAAFGVYIHGLAGEMAAQQKGEYSVLATDLIESIGSIMKAGNLE